MVDLTAADVATLRLVPVTALTGEPAGSTEPVQPVYTRYWRHNTGPAPIGNLPVTVHVHPSRLLLDPGATGQVRITVGCSGRPASGHVEFADGQTWPYDLAAGEFTEFTAPVTARPGRHLLAARVRDHLGQVLEDTVEVVSDPLTGTDLVDVRLGTDSLDLVPGGRATLPVTLVNLAHSEVRGEITVISPHGTWHDDVRVGPRTLAFTIPAQDTITVPLVATATATARGGAHWWALVRVAAHGRLLYSPAIPVTVR
jgi:hypothetical protein